MKKFYVYVLKCKDAPYYIGHTDLYNQAFASRYEAICAKCKLKK